MLCEHVTVKGSEAKCVNKLVVLLVLFKYLCQSGWERTWYQKMVLWNSNFTANIPGHAIKQASFWLSLK